MKFLEAATKWKAFLDLFKKAPQDESSAQKKLRRVVIIFGVVLLLVLLVVGIALLIRRWKQRRLQKEAEQEALSHYATDFDADEYEETQE